MLVPTFFTGLANLRCVPVLGKTNLPSHRAETKQNRSGCGVLLVIEKGIGKPACIDMVGDYTNVVMKSHRAGCRCGRSLWSP